MSGIRMIAGSGAVLVAAMALALVGGCSTETSTGGRSADQHATTAGVVMQRSRAPEPTSWAVQSVIGRGADDTIEALQADGTTYAGTVVLRISVSGNSGAFGSNSDAVRCYRYTFRHLQGDEKPHEISCPAGANPVSLPVLTDHDLASTEVQQLLVTVLQTAQAVPVNDAGLLKQRVEAAIGPPAQVSVSTEGANGYGARIDEGDQCLTVTLAPSGSATVPTVRAAHGADCYGG